MGRGSSGWPMATPRLSVLTRLLRDIALVLVAGAALAVALITVQDRLVPRWISHDDFVFLEAGVLVLVGYLLARAFGRAIHRAMNAEGTGRHVSFVRLLVNALIGIVVAFALFGLSGVSIQNLFFGSALAGVVLGLASQTVLGNVFAGLVIVLVGPFRPHERISIISSSYGAMAPTYPHELLYPTYSGTVLDVGLFYTTMQLDSGRVAQIPNSVVLTALIVNLTSRTLRSQRVRITLPTTVSLARVEEALEPVRGQIRGPRFDTPPARIEVADISKDTWDAVVVVWTTEPSEEQVRDTILRSFLPLVGAAGSPGPDPPTGRPASHNR